ncbi:Sodium potassium-dependent ATPase beta-2 subunit [Nesidiocoris tenuis]|uniref:Sodium potassium-dependent ATPase beta-2 subunit n=1 Tax=Nesidiocoris tenuis TaxID=355587 RepID=A0ABN7AAR7_9HEMI|nr:Sodium potassium-dependent ATPase beta-2 subunit [Nesidiocoris tenuis]
MSKSGQLAKKVGRNAGGQSENTYEWEFAKPKENLTTGEKFKRAIYDPSDGSYLGRTPIMWLKLMIFYIIFYLILAILFMICIYGLLLSTNEKYPTYTLGSSLIGTNPGLGFRPMPDNFLEGNAVIWMIPSNKTNVDSWVASMDDYLTVYKSPPTKKGARQMCDYDSPATEGKVCNVDVDSSDWGMCTSAHKYGFAKSSPCVFIKLNRIYGWVPEYYNNTNDLPAEMPDDLKTYIKKIKDVNMLNTVWISCHGETPTDKENIGPMEMYPVRGFPGYYYPFTNQDGYLSPLVAIHFRRPAMHSLIAVECRIWAKNAQYSKAANDRQGSVHFELLLD